MLHQLIHTFPQARGTPELRQLIRRKDFTGYLFLFLLSCKAQGLSPATINGYRKFIGLFIQRLGEMGIALPGEVVADHIRLFLLKQQETCNPISVCTYYRHIKCFFNWLVEEGHLERSPMEEMKDTKSITMKNGKPATQGVCPVCGTKMFRIGKS